MHELDSWHTYPKVYAMGHKAIADLLLDDVLVEEKVDGSQFSFGKFLDAEGNEYLRCRSRGVELNVAAPDNMFQRAVDTVKAIFAKLHVGWTYRGEYLARPKHNTLCYSRTPVDYIVLFDINTGHEEYMGRAAKVDEADRLGLELVPILYEGRVDSIDLFRSFLDRESYLGGQKVEGVVVKNYARFGLDKKCLMGKFVSEEFKEIHAADWKDRNPKQGDILERLVDKYRTPARWAKAVQHLSESGQIETGPRDIGKLIPAAAADVLAECETEIRDALFQWAWPHIRRGVTSGLPEWYKEELLKASFAPA